MNIKHILMSAIALLLNTALLNAAETYQASLQAGDAHRNDKKYTEALADYESALSQANTDTERGLALSKKSYVYAYDLKDYSNAKENAEKALQLQDTQAVARVTALQVLAECQMKFDKNYVEATKTLEQAMQLGGVEWAKPILNLMLGDCYRFSDQFDQAMASYQRVVDGGDAGIKAIAYLNMGITNQYNLRNFEKAKEAYAKVVKLKPDLKGEIDAHLAKMP